MASQTIRNQSASAARRSLRLPLNRLRNANARINLFIGLILAVFSFAMFYPFLWLIFSSFKSGDDIVRIPVSLLHACGR